MEKPSTDESVLVLSEEFLRLFAQNQRRIYGYIVTLLPRHADAEEVLQQTNLILWRRFADFRPDADFIAWAFGIARNEVRRYLRDRDRQVVALDEDVLELLAGVQVNQGELLSVQRAALSHCLEKLVRKDRDLISRCYENDLTIKQVAEQIGRPLNTVYKAVARIRKSLFECIERRTKAEGRV